MRKYLPIILMLLFLSIPASALEIEAPMVPKAGKELMPEETDSFAEGISGIFKKSVQILRPDLGEAVRLWVELIAVVLIISLLNLCREPAGFVSNLAGAVCIAVLLLSSANSMIRLAENTVRQLSDYGKLLFPVMAAGLAAQGGVTASSGLYLGTTVFSTFLNTLLSGIFLKGIYFYLVLAVASAALGEDVLKRLRDMIKGAISWTLKILLTAFTTYMSITGVVSGTTDAATLKALKVTISTMVPVVGGILSDASESVLVSAALMKNAAGIYGIFALLSLFLGPFLRIGIHYLILKASVLVCGVFGSKTAVMLIEDFSSALGLLLAITGSMCMLLLIGTVCFLKGVGG